MDKVQEYLDKVKSEYDKFNEEVKNQASKIKNSSDKLTFWSWFFKNNESVLPYLYKLPENSGQLSDDEVEQILTQTKDYHLQMMNNFYHLLDNSLPR